ncbi:capsid assembly scaffolding protein Gp46 family protein [Ignavigranum ruoffiae]|uniref:capsid assembly scaffolding protein Gp46 family protein n=1 Tax=Ignavigranum ruoffiae TaxID=89093 RepID=UPI00235751A2|nr:DUF4355 domain-containing protein [Ignavigranum ruoffiae]
MKNMLPLNLQLFAEPAGSETDEAVEQDVNETEVVETQEETETKLDAEKVVEKLQKRLDSKTKAEKETKSQLEEALNRIAELEQSSKKSVKDQSEEDKQNEIQKAKDEEIAQLRQQIKLSQITQQADEVLKEAGLTVGKEMLSMLVNEDKEVTYSNIKSLISFLDSQQKQWEIKRNTGKTPERFENKQDNAFDVIINKYKRSK